MQTDNICQSHFDKKANGWSLLYKKHSFHDRLNLFTDNLTEVLKPPARILDYGCGSGVISLRLAELGFDVVGVDAAKGMITEANKARVQSGYKNVKFTLINPDTFIPDHSTYDAVICSSVIEYVVNDEELLALLCQSIKQGGYILFSVPHKSSIIGLIEDVLVYVGLRKSDIIFSKRRYKLHYIVKFLSGLSLNSFKHVYFELPMLGKFGVFCSRYKYIGVMVLIRSQKVI